MPDPAETLEVLYTTVEEAILTAMVESEDGDEIIVHEPWCSSGRDPRACSCEPWTIVVRKGSA